MREERRYAAVVAAFATILYLACVVAAFGLISLYTNRDVIVEADAGPLIGPVMTAVATVALFGGLLWVGLRVPAERQRLSPLAALGVGAVCYLLFVFVGSVLYSFGSHVESPFLAFWFSNAASAFSLTTGIVAFVVVLAYQLVLIGRFRQRGRPLWPWEHKDD
jgi:Family of unknown function (DUF6121)